MMRNLLEETEEFMRKAGLFWDEVIFIGSADKEYKCSVEEFKVLANHVYDPGYGAQEVASDLVIDFESGAHMSRYEYDGSEHWELYVDPPMREQTKKIHRLIGGMWATIDELQEMYEEGQRNG